MCLGVSEKNRRYPVVFLLQVVTNTINFVSNTSKNILLKEISGLI
jgi:hypothetical protein